MRTVIATKTKFDTPEPPGARIIPVGLSSFAIVDESDYPVVMAYAWSFKNGYAVTGKTALMHRFLLQAGVGVEVDHINGDRFDNRRCNLRVCTRQQNNWNRGKAAVIRGVPAASRHRGVYFNNGHWYAALCKDGTNHRIGKFASETEAAQAYNRYASHLFGEYARLNDVPEAEVAPLPTHVPLRLSAWGDTKTVLQWAKDPRCVVSKVTLRDRLNANWGPEDALQTPARPYRTTKKKVL